MKKAIVCLLSVLLSATLFTLVSCGSDGDSGNTVNLSELIGKSWKIESMTIDLYDDMTFEYKEDTSTETLYGSYSYTSSNITLTPMGAKSKEGDFSPIVVRVSKNENGNILFTTPDGTTGKVRLVKTLPSRKINGSLETPPFAGDQNIETYLPSLKYNASVPMVGVWWQYDHNETNLKEYKIQIFYADGTYKKLEYEILNGKKTVKIDENDSGIYTYSPGKLVCRDNYGDKNEYDIEFDSAKSYTIVYSPSDKTTYYRYIK